MHNSFFIFVITIGRSALHVYVCPCNLQRITKLIFYLIYGVNFFSFHYPCLSRLVPIYYYTVITGVVSHWVQVDTARHMDWTHKYDCTKFKNLRFNSRTTASVSLGKWLEQPKHFGNSNNDDDNV